MNKQKWFKLTIVTLSLIFLLNAYVLPVFAADPSEDGQGYMKFDSEDLKRWAEYYENATRAEIDPETVEKLKVAPAAHFDLLSHLNYVPADRNQGFCGNCWVWAPTGIVEVALSVQEGIYDRLSIQYFNSKWPGSPNWACCGGFIDWYADWTEAEGFVIPWSNTNAHWQDGGQSCGGSTTVPWGSISTTPRYDIVKCDDLIITTTGVPSATAIANIKAILNSNKAVWFGFWLTDFNTFRTFWNGQPESAIWDPPTGGTWSSSSGAHAVLCVGYDDTDPDNPYWIIVNSWGTTATRPNGIFRLSMNMDYSGTFYDPPGTYWSFQFATLDVEFDIPEPPPVGGVYTTANKLMAIAPWVILCGTIATVVVGVLVIKKRTF